MSTPEMIVHGSHETDSAVEKAVLAERERCAKIASASQYEDRTSPQEGAWNAACIHVASRIRGQL